MATAHFGKANSVDIVIGQNANATDERLRQVKEVITHHLRGMFRTGRDGGYWFKAVRAKFYSVPTDSRVGTLLDDLGRHGNRRAQPNYIVSKDRFDEVTTHLCDPDDPYIDSDAVFGVKKSLIADFNRVDDPARIAKIGFEGNHYLDVEFDFILAPKG